MSAATIGFLTRNIVQQAAKMRLQAAANHPLASSDRKCRIAVPRPSEPHGHLTTETSVDERYLHPMGGVPIACGHGRQDRSRVFERPFKAVDSHRHARCSLGGFCHACGETGDDHRQPISGDRKGGPDDRRCAALHRPHQLGPTAAPHIRSRHSRSPPRERTRSVPQLRSLREPRRLDPSGHAARRPRSADRLPRPCSPEAGL
jgi:hypothetical protein